ncbi:hypothetical protein B6V74_07710 [Thioclava sp. F42-5]|nr:hypothetical protein B6V74_07710 [Thioclava sp. F42-5]
MNAPSRAPGKGLGDEAIITGEFTDPINDVATLNMRSAPSTGASIVTRLADGQNLRNLGCSMAEGRRWCQVATLADPGFEGWAAGEYLIEGTGTPTRAEAAPSPKPKIVTGSGQEHARFASGSSDARLHGGLQPGKSRRYLLNARDGQDLNLRVMVQEAPPSPTESTTPTRALSWAT